MIGSWYFEYKEIRTYAEAQKSMWPAHGTYNHPRQDEGLIQKTELVGRQE